MRRVHVFLLAILLLGGGVAITQSSLAQTENPEVTYNGVPIEIEIDKGPVQGCVTKVITTEDLKGITVESEGVVITSFDDKWAIPGMFNGAVESGAPGSHIGDCWHIEWDTIGASNG